MTASCQLDITNVDNINISDFDYEIQELGGNVEKIVETFRTNQIFVRYYK